MCFFRECAFGASIHTVVIEFQLVSPLRATKQGVFVALRQPKWQSVCNLSGTTDLFVSYFVWGVIFFVGDCYERKVNCLKGTVRTRACRS